MKTQTNSAAPEGCAPLPCSPLMALSIRQPWAWLIVNGHKDIENRSWPTRFRGRISVHAGKGMTRDEYEEASWTAENNGVTLPPYEQLERGGIVGEVEIVDCVNRSESPWFFGDYGFVLRNGKTLPFQPCKGALGFFSPVNNMKSNAAAVKDTNGGLPSSRSANGSQFVLAWSSGHEPPKAVYFRRTETAWCGTYDRAEATRFRTRSDALNQWRKVHAFPEEHEHCIQKGRVRAEYAGEPELSF